MDLATLGPDSLLRLRLLFAVTDVFRGVPVAETGYDRVLEIVGRVLRHDVNPMLDFFDNGATSLALVHIIELIRVECGVDIWLTNAFDAPDVGSFARRVAGNAATAAGEC